ncbi:MAG TPA: LysR family transcriptional regulator [Albitalea sp.]|uniref:LysR family transcriptional regulator n=1 Tax=Piscinibacter sp. TaxID=1903157 RepID=UPI002ED482F1
MDRLGAILIFNSVVEHRSFSRAADALGLTPTVVTRRVQELEALLGVRLLNRSTRRISLTSVGDEVLTRTTRLLSVYDELTSIGTLSVSEVRGTIRLAAPDFYARRHLGAALAGYVARHREVCVDLRLSEGGLDGLDDDLDLALCLERDLRPSLIARQVAVVPVSVYASRAYLERKGVPAHPADLPLHDCLIWDGSRNGPRWQFEHVSSGERHSFSTRGGLHSTHAEVLVHAAAHGAGIVIVPVFIVEEAVAAGALVPLMPAWRPEPLAIHLAYRSRRQQPLALRRLIDHLACVLGDGEGSRAQESVAAMAG